MKKDKNIYNVINEIVKFIDKNNVEDNKSEKEGN